MKRSNWVRLIAVILIISMLAAPVSAASYRGNDSVRTNGVVGVIVEFIRDIIRDIFDDWFDKPGEEEPVPTTPVNPTTPTPTEPGETEPEETEPTEPGETQPGETKPTQPGETQPGETDPTEPGETEPEETEPTEPGETKPEETEPTEPGETKPAEDEKKPETSLELIEGHENTENGHLLRGHTYSLSQIIAEQNKKPMTTATANRFGTKLGNGLGGNSIGTGLKPMGGLSVMADDAEITISDTALVITYDENGNAVIENGQYVLGIVGGKYVTNVSANSDWGYTLSGTSSKVSATIWTITRQADGSYTVQDPNNEYLSVTGLNKATMSATPVYFSIQQYGSNTVLKQLNADNKYCYLNALGSITSSSFGGWTEGSPICLYSVTTAEPEEPVDPSDSSRDIPVDVLTPTAGESQNGQGPARVLDDDASTLWHTTYTGTDRSTHWIQFQLSEDYLVDGLRYLPRSSGGDNGIITQYQIQVSDDGNTFRTVASGNWENNSSWKVANFTAVNAKYVRLVSVNAITDQSYIFASAAEIRLTGTKLNDESELVDLELDIIPRYMTNRLEWNAESGVTYTVQRSEDNLAWDTIGTSDNGNYLDTTAGKGTQYYYRIITDTTHTASVQGITTGMNALKEIAVLFYEDNDNTHFDGSAKVIIAEGEKADELNALESGTIVYKATVSNLSSKQGVMGTNNDRYVGLNGDKFRHELGNLSGETGYPGMNAGANTAGFVYDDSNGHWALCSNGGNVTTKDLNKANFGLLTDVGATTYYAGGSPSYRLNGTINYIMILDEVLTDAELKELTRANENHDVETPVDPIKLVYMPVTMFNYDMDTMNDMTNSMYEKGSKLFSGMHFSNGTPASKDSVTYATTAHTGEYTNGQYVIQNYLMKDNSQPSWLTCRLVGEKGITATSNQAEATIWTLTRVPGANVFTLTTEINGTTYYMTMGNETSGVTTEYSEITLVYYTHTKAGIQITKDGYYLGHSEGNLFCGNTDSTSRSNGMGFFPVEADGTIGATARNVTTINGAVTSGFSRWNWWSYLEDNNAAQNKFFAELVQHELDANNDIVFNVIEPGIFKTGTGENIAKKDVYTNVGLPFVLNEEGIYSFNSDLNGVYFADTDGDGTSDPASGTATDPYKLAFEPGAPQGWTGMKYGDGSSNLWAPFNTNANDTGEGKIDYHFGMRANLPFSMTPNGRVEAFDDSSAPITFTFSGDDDVWIFIDGHLVIDLGGIHNRIGATIDFANNTITYFLPVTNTNNSELGCYNDRTRYPLNADGKTITVKLYNDADGEGALGKTRNDFASQEEHFMNIFYLERGKGTSNCHIEFNLPMRDTLLVTKDATKSWSQAADDNDGDAHDGTYDLTAKEQEAVNNMDFGFTLYKRNAGEAAFSPVANTNFYVQNQDDVVLKEIKTTDSNGHFTLKNAQTAKFITDFPKEGVTYYVVEDTVPAGFLTPDFNYDGECTNGMTWYDSTVEFANITSVGKGKEIPEQELPLKATENKSYIVTAKGSIESIDSLEFICTNYMDATLPNPTAIANEDTIVIDYGLPVRIDPLANDLCRADVVRIAYWGDETLTLEGYQEALEADTLSAPKTEFDFGTVAFENGVSMGEQETRDTFIYTLNKQLTEVEVISYIIEASSSKKQEATDEIITETRYSLAKVYIVPATIMYYEENFSDMILFEGAGWDAEHTIANSANVSPFQEPGVMGTIGDSTYGSDVAYLSDNGDSNGTYRFGDTANKAIRFTYTFTGTGTSIFARTSAETGYMRVQVYAIDGNTETLLNTTFRDTYWKDENDTNLDSDGTLYNIPVFTENLKTYGTYKVVCTVAKAGSTTAGNTDGAGNEFYLDGIRVMQPLNEKSDSELVRRAQGAYAADGESNLEVVTLRKKLIQDNQSSFDPETGKENDWPFAVLTDINDEVVTASDYISIGPKEEVYLSKNPSESNGQKVSFSLKYWQPEGLKLYMGMKAPFGSAEVNVGREAYELNNAPDCYYDVTSNYASQVTAYEQLRNSKGYLLFNDPNNNEVYMDENGAYFYSSNNAPVAADTKLTPKDDPNQPYYIVTYTFEAAESIVSLTNIKVVGQYKFTNLIRNTDIHVVGYAGED